MDNLSLDGFNIQPFDHSPSQRFCLGLLHTIVQRSEEDVIINRGAEDLFIHILHDDAYLLSNLGISLSRVNSKNSHASVLRNQDSEEMSEERRLSTTVGP